MKTGVTVNGKQRSLVICIRAMSSWPTQQIQFGAEQLCPLRQNRTLAGLAHNRKSGSLSDNEWLKSGGNRVDGFVRARGAD